MFAVGVDSIHNKVVAAIHGAPWVLAEAIGNVVADRGPGFAMATMLAIQSALTTPTTNPEAN